MKITLKVNGEEHTVDVDSAKPLLWVLREDLGMTGTKYGCGIGQCRACTVLADGYPVRACVYTASALSGKTIKTIEGVSGDRVDALRDAWAAAGASQCGYCQPGQILAAYALLGETSNPTDDDIDAGMPNLCRCGTYPRIRQAIKDAAAALKGK